MRSFLPLVIWACIKCGVIQFHMGPCDRCHSSTQKEVIDDLYLEDGSVGPGC